MIELSDEIKRIPVQEDKRTHAYLPAYGMLEEIEIRPRIQVWNTDASSPLRLAFILYDGNGNEIPCDITLIARGIK